MLTSTAILLVAALYFIDRDMRDAREAKKLLPPPPPPTEDEKWAALSTAHRLNDVTPPAPPQFPWALLLFAAIFVATGLLTFLIVHLTT